MSSTAVPPCTCVTHGYHGCIYCPRCSTSAIPPASLRQAPSAATVQCAKCGATENLGVRCAHPDCPNRSAAKVGRTRPFRAVRGEIAAQGFVWWLLRLLRGQRTYGWKLWKP